MGALTLSNIITGKTNPSPNNGWFQELGQIPIFYNHLNAGRPYSTGGEFESKYLIFLIRHILLVMLIL